MKVGAFKNSFAELSYTQNSFERQKSCLFMKLFRRFHDKKPKLFIESKSNLFVRMSEVFPFLLLLLLTGNFVNKSLVSCMRPESF